ncbi:hypothetical protein C9374_001317 [Naegleria lovaniensis]|uniref:Uncharacterized protein n=1 Tax=Naegleria lovaniensis TaxID=51637 RepID=A0AA88GWN2_NAELO|nr:uncharacterized protein C9374_001317 [Naegleria lovaniensis]KAG2387723.1 hypothetical protein C9374_001317 [Naegleria lovaniensis]
MPSHLFTTQPGISLQFGSLDLGSNSQPKSHQQSNMNQSNPQANQQMQNGQYWTDPKTFIPYFPSQYPYHPQYYPYIYQYYQPTAGQGVNANKNFNQGFYQQQEGYGMYNQHQTSTGTEENEQTHQDAYHYQMQQPYFVMYPQHNVDAKQKSESPQHNEQKTNNPYPYLPGYQSQYPQYFPNQMMYPTHYPSAGNTTTNPNSNTSQSQKKW